MWYANVIITLFWVMAVFPTILLKNSKIWVVLGSVAWVSYSITFALAFTEDSQLTRGAAGSALGLVGGWCWYRFITLRKPFGVNDDRIEKLE